MPPPSRLIALFLAAGVTGAGLSVAGPTYEVVASFEAGPKNPDSAALLLQPDGNLYGTVPFGGASDAGCVYRVLPDGTWSVLHQFSLATGGNSYTGLTADSAGNLYGVTSAGGSNGQGTVFRLAPGGGYSILVNFTGNSGVAPGAGPLGQLVVDAGGNIYGTTQRGGLSDIGTVFRITSAGAFSVLGEFSASAPARGAYPFAGLTPDGAGGFWGTTVNGGTQDLGAVYRISGSGVFTSVVSFSGAGGAAPGQFPLGGLWRDGSDGSVYGTTSAGGAHGCGTVFRITESGVFSSLASFTGSTGALPGCSPRSTLSISSTGVLAGVTSGSPGTAFTVSRNTGTVTHLASFPAASGPPLAPLTPGPGTGFSGTFSGSGQDRGSIFRLQADGSFSIETRFNGNARTDLGSNPRGGVIVTADGVAWGTTHSGGLSGRGTVFKADSAGITTVASFDGPQRGANPYGPLLLEPNGTSFLGTAYAGGSSGQGTLYRVGREGSFTTLANFTGTDPAAPGARPIGGLARGEGPQFFGTTSGSGTNPGGGDHGTIFSWSEETGLLPIRNFTGTFGSAPGSQPTGALVRETDGSMMGTTRLGGFQGHGSLFRRRKSGAYEILASFTGTGGATPGSQPHGNLVTDGTGAWYGVTRSGGSTNNGTIFRLRAFTHTLLASFTGSTGAVRGSQPLGGLVLRDGWLYGTTSAGGAANLGSLFRISTTGVFEHLASFTGAAGAVPGASPGYAPLTLHTDGNLYGAAQNGGPGGGGLIFRLRFGPAPVTLPADSIGPGVATLHGTADPNSEATTVSFQWGPTAALGQETSGQAAGSGTEPLAVSATIAPSKPGTRYYFRIKAANASGTQYGATLSFSAPLSAGPALCLFSGPARSGSLLTPGQPGVVDLGSSFPGYPIQRTFTVVNAGNAALTLSSAGIVSPFQVLTPLPLTIQPGEDAALELLVAAGSVGAATGTLSLGSNDLAVPSADFPLAASILSGSPFPASVPVQSPVISGGCIFMDYPVVPGFRYVVESSTDLQNWQSFAPMQTANASTLSIVDSVRGTRHFYRARFIP